MGDKILETATPEVSVTDIFGSDVPSESQSVDSFEGVELGGESSENSQEISPTITQDSKDYEPIIADSTSAIVEAVTLAGSDVQAVYYDASSAIVNTMLFCTFLIVGMLTALKIFGGRV